jgi:hypothetical protein
VNDVDIKTLINSAVDAELDGHRAAPPWDRAALAGRRGPAHTVRLWSAPLLAASVAVLLAVGAMLAITLNRGQNHVRNPAGPAPVPSMSLSQSTTEAEPEEADRAYAEAMAGAREATEVAGVSVGPLSARDAARLKGTGLMTGDISSITTPKPGTTYSFTLSYLAGPSDDWPAVLTTEVQDVASGTCAQPFLVRPGHAYVIRCQAMLLAGVTGKATLTLRTPTGTTAGSLNLTDPPKPPVLPSSSFSIPPSQPVTAREYSEAVAAAPEASKVAGIEDQPVTNGEAERGEGFGVVDGPASVPDPGRSYSLTLLYVSGSDAPPVSVLAISIEDVAASRCPSAFRTRPNHSYNIRCQVTFRAGAVAKAYYHQVRPQGRSTSGLSITIP